MTIIYADVFIEMQSYKTLDCSQNERFQMKHRFLDRIKEKVVIRWDRAKKVQQVIDEIIYKGTDRGYSFNGRETLAAKCGVSLRTVDRAFQLLKLSGEVVFAYRHNPSSNSRKTPVVFLKAHKNFQHWKEILKLDCKVDGEKESVKNPDVPKDEPAKTGSYLSFTQKQESNIIIGSQDKVNNHPQKNIVNYVVNRINDAMKKGTAINYVSSYVDRIYRSLERKALAAENLRLLKLRKEREKEYERLALEAGVRPSKPIERPFYDWLNT